MIHRIIEYSMCVNRFIKERLRNDAIIEVYIQITNEYVFAFLFYTISVYQWER